MMKFGQLLADHAPAGETRMEFVVRRDAGGDVTFDWTGTQGTIPVNSELRQAAERLDSDIRYCLTMEEGNWRVNATAL